MVQQLFAYRRGSENRLLHSALLDRLDQTAVCNNGLDKFRERCHVEFLAVGDVTDDAVVQVSLYGVALADGVHSLRTLHDRKTDVDGVAVEDTGKALGDDQGDAAFLNGDGACSREEPQPKFSPPTMMSPGFTRLVKVVSRSSMQWEASSFLSMVFR